VHRRYLTKPDGRRLILYSHRPIADDIVATSPSAEPVDANPHLRWHPLRGEWVAYAGHRHARTFLPAADRNPFAPTTDNTHPTELPPGDYDIAVFDNRFPTLVAGAHDPPASIIETRPGIGSCELVVYGQDPTATLATLPLDHVELLLDVWADRTRELGAHPDVRYVMPFENRGVEVGATLHHPHGQIYAYPFIPPIPARELELQCAYFKQHGSGVLADLIASEIADRRRVLYQDALTLAFVPAWARYPYEVWVAPRAPAASLTDLDASTRGSLAIALQTVGRAYDAFWGGPFPYVMIIHQAPTDGGAYPHAHLHFEFYPPYRMPGRLKYLAGTELGAGLFANDRLPEETATELRAALDDANSSPH
jgi:UDPglucose--hexose-1-phosphate uridylyltransferase